MPRLLFAALLLILAGLGFVIRPEHPHFEAEKYDLFWPSFALLTCIGLLLLAKKLVYPMLTTHGPDPREDDHDRLP